MVESTKRRIERRATAALSPLRRSVLDQLQEPASASELARRLGLPRQKLNYHLRELERLGLIELAEERQQRGFTERRYRAVARDRFSSAYLLKAAAQMTADVASLREGAEAAGQNLATFTIDLEIDFASPDALRAFTGGLSEVVARLAAEHHQPAEPEARRYRLVIGGHPLLTKNPTSTEPKG